MEWFKGAYCGPWLWGGWAEGWKWSEKYRYDRVGNFGRERCK
jgi:hypothetical protein